MFNVFVALSGGVDSSVAAFLLKKAGNDVSGVFMRLADSYQAGEKMARLAAKKIGIPFLVFDFRQEFKKKVIDYFLKQTKAGLTPNPCVICNEEIKFGLFLDKALKMGADFIATGHYVRIENTKYKILNTKYKLLKAKDTQKDQSYFLWRLGQKQLSRVLFPLGGYTKSEVRLMAKKAGLPTAAAKESQDLCFLVKGSADFLRHNLKAKTGDIIEAKTKKVIGRHFGLGFYTIGQSQGFGAGIFPKEQAKGPYFVLRKETKKNLLIVTRNKNDLLSKECLVKEVNWISGKTPILPLKAKVKIRSRQTEMAAVILKTKKAGQVLVRFTKLQMAVTPGQSAVFYRGNELIGGGVIVGI